MGLSAGAAVLRKVAADEIGDNGLAAHMAHIKDLYGREQFVQKLNKDFRALNADIDQKINRLKSFGMGGATTPAPAPAAPVAR